MCIKLMCIKLFGQKPITPPVTDTPVLPVPESETITITREAFVAKMREYGIEPVSMATPLDSIVRLASKTELDRIAPELVYPADWYAETLWDCEDYALQAQCDAGRKFEITVRLGLGNMDLGYHGFALTLDRDLNLRILEPNGGFPYAGQWFRKGIYNYLPDKVFI